MMFVKHRTEGIIFKKENFGESDQLFKIFTKDFGKIEVLGKGIRKISSKLRSGMEIFYLSEIEFVQGKIHKTLTDAICLEKFQNLRKNLKKLAIAYKIAEDLENFIKGEEPEEKIWRLLSEVFQELDDLKFKTYNLQLIYYYFFWNLISLLGYRPELHFCLACQKKLEPKGLYFSKKDGGIICQNCFQKTREGEKVSKRVVKILRIFLEKDIQILKRIMVNKEDFEKLRKISDNYYNFLFKKNYEIKNF
jgi:DNA repair protein RecO (recombination protein O)